MKEFSPKRNEFFYVKVSDTQSNRDNKLSQLLGDDIRIFYLGANNKSVDKIYLSKFWKDKLSANRVVSKLNNHISLIPGSKKDIVFELVSIDRKEFIKSIPDSKTVASFSTDDYVYKKNLQLKREEVNYQEKEAKFISQYKAISAYRFPDNWFYYLPCPNCGLRPLVWEFNNGRSTACGCGENEYNHFSIKAESIMSYTNRNNGSALGYLGSELELNWNQWVKTKQVVFEPGGGRW